MQSARSGQESSSMAQSTILFALIHFLVFISFSHGELLINAGGPGFPCSSNPENVFTRGSGVRADTGRWASKDSTYYRQRFPLATGIGSTFVPREPLNLPPRAALFYSHRYARMGDLVYTLPVPNGKFEVNLYFAENWKGARSGTRQFFVMINGKLIKNGARDDLDVFDLVGFGNPHVVRGGVTEVMNGKLVIRLKRIQGRNNPMISGIQVLATSEEQARSKNLDPEALVGEEGVVHSRCKPLQCTGTSQCQVNVNIFEKHFLNSSQAYAPRTIVYQPALDDFFSRPSFLPRLDVKYDGNFSGSGPDPFDFHRYVAQFDLSLIYGVQYHLLMYETNAEGQRVERVSIELRTSKSRTIETCSSSCQRSDKSIPNVDIQIGVTCIDADVLSISDAQCGYCLGGIPCRNLVRLLKTKQERLVPTSETLIFTPSENTPERQLAFFEKGECRYEAYVPHQEKN